ncbi:MAG: hypothetical protein J0H77_10655 [Alphaproteobacteria bacterium]|jgi:hypothetical protein|nr:hypothetical protein [Alphaproteobacteria bacterium]
MKAATELDILSLFVTVIALFDVPDAVSLNAQLRRVIEQRERTHPAGRVRSNLGGWQSSDDMETWGVRRPSSCWHSRGTSRTA